MGRYSSVQAYADNQTNVRSLSYQQATGSTEAKKGTVKAEKVSNPYGSTAGAGSGEFHIYRHARAREMARWDELDASAREKELEEQFQEELRNCRTEEERKTAKKRRKRQREKEAKQRKKVLRAQGIGTSITADAGALKVPSNEQHGEEEFTYIPLAEQEEQHKGDEENRKDEDEDEGDSKAEASTADVKEIRNDGSFLEIMKKRLASEQAVTKNDEDEGPILPPPAKKQAVSKIIDEDEYDDEGPMLPPPR